MLRFEEIDPYIAKCVRCGTCKAVFGLFQPACPAGERFGFEGFYSSGKIWIARGIREGVLRWDDPEVTRKLFACTLCGNCTQQCPMTVRERIMEVFEALRAEAVKRAGTPYAEHQRLKDSLIQYRNPWMQPRRRRLQWARGESLKILKPGGRERARVLYYVGCTAALDASLQHVARNTVRLLRKAGVDFGILGEEEVCCGSVMHRVGERELAGELALKNLEMIRALGVETVVTSCAGCFKTLSQDVPAYGEMTARVVHSSQLLRELFRAGRLTFDKEPDLRVTYHDPCHMGRHCGEYDAPRELLTSQPGIRLVEMPRSRENAWCCGAGGGVRSAFPDWALETSRTRVEEAAGTGAALLVTTCPFCLQNLTTAVRAEGSPLELVDLTDLLVRLLS